AQSSTVITLQSEGCSLFDRNYLLTFRPEPTPLSGRENPAVWPACVDESRIEDRRTTAALRVVWNQPAVDPIIEESPAHRIDNLRTLLKRRRMRLRQKNGHDQPCIRCRDST
ncbi:hypothetical protein, partial [Mycobacterium sp. 852013-50091_SCH5140682]|uniref:hypothetical protein n=1 Tax=Mycobacterium sp. 852013-50091_SCH5140682 TaxID=1834109 RepID=UPI001E55F007